MSTKDEVMATDRGGGSATRTNRRAAPRPKAKTAYAPANHTATSSRGGAKGNNNRTAAAARQRSAANRPARAAAQRNGYSAQAAYVGTRAHAASARQVSSYVQTLQRVAAARQPVIGQNPVERVRAAQSGVNLPTPPDQLVQSNPIDGLFYAIGQRIKEVTGQK